MTNKHTILALLGIPLFIVAFAVATFYALHHSFPTFDLLCHWDCGWYTDVKNNGYVFIAGEQCNVAFFPLLPYLWKWSGLSVFGISTLNFLVFTGSAVLLVRHFSINHKTLITFLSIGLVGFFLIPYTESLFFIGSSLMLIGLNKKNYLVLTLGIFIAIITRSASMIFIVALVVSLGVEWFCTPKNKQYFIILYAVVLVVLTTLVVLCFQYLQTGEFLGFFKTHAEWGHHLQLPQLPLSGWHWPVPLTDSFALIIGVSCMLILIGYVGSHFSFVPKKWASCVFHINGTLALQEVFTLLYLSGGSLFILLYQGGNLSSINRYVLSTPFYLVLLHLLQTRKIIFNVSPKVFIIILLVLNFIMPHAYPEHLFFVFISNIILAFGVFYALQSTEKKWVRFFQIACIIGIILQSVLFTNYLKGMWMG